MTLYVPAEHVFLSHMRGSYRWPTSRRRPAAQCHSYEAASIPMSLPATASVMQGSASDIIKMAMISAQQAIDERCVCIPHNRHRSTPDNTLSHCADTRPAPRPRHGRSASHPLVPISIPEISSTWLIISCSAHLSIIRWGMNDDEAAMLDGGQGGASKPATPRKPTLVMQVRTLSMTNAHTHVHATHQHP